MRANDSDLADRVEPDPGRKLAVSIARGALLIASVTVFSRILGLVRTLIFSQAIGATCLGSAYLTAYQVPNLIAELALGGTLTSAMVPVLARSAARADTDPAEKANIARICSALLTWAMIVLIPLAVAIVAAAGPIASLLTPANAHAGCPHADVVQVTTRMIEVFAPQLVFYGIAVVLIGLLQAYRRFAGPAVSPILVSLVLIATYVSFSALNHGRSLANTPLTAELVLGIGTTLSIAVLLLTVVAPTWRLHLRFRLALGLPPEIARRVGALVTVGIVEFLATDLSTLVVVALANGRGSTGALVLFNYAFLVYNAMFAVLVISIVTSAFPALAAHDGTELDRTSAGSTRAIVLMSWLGFAMICAVAWPTGHVLAKHPDQVPQLIGAFLMAAPGLAGAAVTANLSRLMLAVGKFRLAALSLGGSWVAVTIIDIPLGLLAPTHLVVPALTLGATIGQTAVAIPVMLVTRRLRGPAALEGVGRAWLGGLVAGLAGAVIGVAVGAGLHMSGKLLEAAVAVVATCCAIVVFGLVAYLVDRPDARAVTMRIREYAKHRVG
jgi:putative peptidoglycan lipid II flippase